LHKTDGWRVLLKEMLISALFLRPFVDAWRVHNKHKNSETIADPLQAMIANKGIDPKGKLTEQRLLNSPNLKINKGE
jgi:hypothetical protein